MCSLVQFILLCISSLYIRQVIGEGRLQFKLIQYSNPNGKAFNEQCCDGRFFTRRIFCETNGGCDHYFKICLDSYHGSENMALCSIGLRITDIVANSLTIDFTERIGPDTANPIDIPFINLEEGVWVKVQVWDNDYGSTNDDHVDSMSKKVMLRPSAREEGAEWSNITLNSRTVMKAQIRAFCDENWFGETCETFCFPQNSTRLGHYSCDNSGGQPICHQGWTGHRCTERVDYCSSSPCRYGSCENSPSDYTCSCTIGFTGADCDVNINDCAGNPCHGERTACLDLINGYRCDCPALRTGPQCETLLNPCDLSPCLSGSTCRNTLQEEPQQRSRDRVVEDSSSLESVEGGYVCECVEGWGGRDCEVEVGVCDSNPCRDQGSTCLEEPDTGSYTCLCATGWIGRNCSEDPCASSPCLNNGICTHNTTLVSQTTFMATLADTSRLTTTTTQQSQAAATTSRATISLYRTTTKRAVTSSNVVEEEEEEEVEESFYCLCGKKYTGKYCETHAPSKPRDMFVPFDKSYPEGSSAVLFDGTVSEEEMKLLKEVLLKWAECIRKGGAEQPENLTQAQCWNSSSSTADSGTLRVNRQTLLKCRSSERKELTAFSFLLMSREEIYSVERTERILETIPLQRLPPSLQQSRVTSHEGVECSLGSAAAHMSQVGPSSNFLSYPMVIGGVVVLVACVVVISVLIALKAKRKVVTKEILVPAYNNPLYCSTHHGNPPIFSEDDDHAHLIQSHPLPNSTTPSTPRGSNGC